MELKSQLPGSLDQDVANAVGLSATEKHLVARFNKPDNVLAIALNDQIYLLVVYDAH